MGSWCNLLMPHPWNTLLSTLPFPHLLQTWEWGDFKAATTGWRPQRIAFMHRNQAVAMAQFLMRQEGPFRVMYVPKGPALDWTNADLRHSVLSEIQRLATDRAAIFVKIDPDIVLDMGEPGTDEDQPNPLGYAVRAEWEEAGWLFSPQQVQFRNSVILDLRRSTDDLLAAMKSKTRYNVRLSGRKSVDIRFGTPEDMDLLYNLYATTATRDGFVIRPLNYYRLAWESFMKAGLAQPILAEWNGHPLGHVIVFGFGGRAWYFYGASSNEERNRMPTYALQWAAIKWAKAQGMQVYDFWGAPDDFADENDPLAGVFRFKDGFGGTVVRRIGAWDFPVKPTLYAAYTRAMPLVLGAMRTVARLRMAATDRQPIGE